jgi:Uma2 family endonuclease
LCISSHFKEIGVPLYWLVDPDAKVVEAWTPEVRFPTIQQVEVR